MKINIVDAENRNEVFPVLRKFINKDNKHLVVLFLDKSHALVLESGENTGHKVGEIKEMVNPFDFSVWQVVTATVKLEFDCKM